MGNVKNLFVILPLIMAAGISESFAQDSLWSASYGGYYNENGYAATRLSNGDFLLVGSTFSYGSGDHDVYLIKTDSTGVELWSRTFGGTAADYGYDITPTASGGFVLVGSTTSYGNGGHDVYLIKVDNFGTLVWSKTFGGAQNDFGNSVRMTSDSGFIICGTTSSYGLGTDIYVIRTDSLGDSLWTKTFGGPSGESGSAIRQAIDSGYVLIGSTGSYGAGYSSIYLVRIGSSGDTLWTATYGGSRADFGYSLEPTSDKGFILAGATAPDGENFYDAYLVKVDSLGVIQWDSTYGGAYEDRAYSVKATADGGYILAGTTEGAGDRKTDVFMVKTDPVGGVEWSDAFGGAETDYGRMVLLDSRGDYYVVGHTFSIGSGGSDVFFLKIQGPVQSAAEPSNPLLPEDLVLLSQNYPNPFNLKTRIEFNLPRRAGYSLMIYNVLGQVVRHYEVPAASAGLQTIYWDGKNERGEDIASGIYIYRLQVDDFVQSKKMVLLK